MLQEILYLLIPRESKDIAFDGRFLKVYLCLVVCKPRLITLNYDARPRSLLWSGHFDHVQRHITSPFSSLKCFFNLAAG